MARRGFTLLELLVAVSLLVAIAAIALPVVVNLDDDAYDTAVEVTKGQLMLARAHAQATGQPVEVLYRTGPRRVEARRFDPATGGLDEEELGALIAEGWAYRPLATGVRLTREPPPDELGDPALRPPGFVLDPVKEASLRIAVYLPDGSAMLAQPVWIVADEARRGRLVVNPWSGLPRLEKSVVEDAEEQDEDREEEEDDPEPYEGEEPDAETGREAGAEAEGAGAARPAEDPGAPGRRNPNDG